MDNIKNSKDVNVGLDYWVQWQVGVCALLIYLPTFYSLKYLFSSGSNRPVLKSGELWVPCWTGLSPVWLLVFRAFSFGSTGFVLYKVVFELRGAFAFYFYTQWTFTLVMIYFALATILSARECWAYSKKPSPRNVETNHLLRKGSIVKKGTIKVNSEVEKKAGFLGHLVQAIYQTCAGASMLTDIVFWGLLYPLLLPADFKLNFTIWCTHSLNAILLVLDSLLNSQPFHWHGFAYYVLWTASYITFQWTLHACGFTWWPYPFLELATPWAPLWYFGMALIHIPCYGFYVLLIRAKSFIFPKMFPHAFVRSPKITKMRSLQKKQS